MAGIKGLSAHDRPPDNIRNIYKKYQRIKVSEVDNDPGIIDLARLDPDDLPASIEISGSMSNKDLRLAFEEFVTEQNAPEAEMEPGRLIEDVPIFNHGRVSGQF
jgi:hypothetical protein